MSTITETQTFSFLYPETTGNFWFIHKPAEKELHRIEADFTKEKPVVGDKIHGTFWFSNYTALEIVEILENTNSRGQYLNPEAYKMAHFKLLCKVVN